MKGTSSFIAQIYLNNNRNYKAYNTFKAIKFSAGLKPPVWTHFFFTMLVVRRLAK